MWLFKFFRHKKKEEKPSRTFEGRVITDEEIKEMTQLKQETFVHKEFREINKMMDELKQHFE